MRRPPASSPSRPAPPPEETVSGTLTDRIAREIRERGAISFDRFMERALYEPGLGYYARGEGLGAAGDYVTAADHGDWFARCLARHVVEASSRLPADRTFHLIEHGAGRGWLARDLVAALDELAPGLSARCRYLAVDRSEAMRRRIAVAAPRALPTTPDALPADVVGGAIAVELFDALPVRRLRRREDGDLVEIGVGLDAGGSLVEVELPADDGLRAIAARRGIAARAGTCGEYCPGLEDTLATLLRPFANGVAWIVDYGDEADKLYGPSRPRGTLLAYRDHGTGERFLEAVGEQDLTAHVDFTALAAAAEELGWRVLGRTTQDRFLIGGGLIEDLDLRAPADDRRPVVVARRMEGTRLVRPAMGRGFRVLVLGRGLDGGAPLERLADPFAR